MRTRHEEITVWTAFREELTSWLCLLDDRFSEELQEAIESGVEVRQIALLKGKAARSTKLWYLLKQALSGFQRGVDLAKFVELSQNGAAAGYELWRALNQELSVRSRVEGQALREQALLIAPEAASGHLSPHGIRICKIPQARCYQVPRLGPFRSRHHQLHFEALA